MITDVVECRIGASRPSKLFTVPMFPKLLHLPHVATAHIHSIAAAFCLLVPSSPNYAFHLFHPLFRCLPVVLIRFEVVSDRKGVLEQSIHSVKGRLLTIL